MNVADALQMCGAASVDFTGGEWCYAANTLAEEVRRLVEQLEAAQKALRDIAALPCYLDVVDQDEPDPRMTSLGDGDCPSCFAALASSPASRLWENMPVGSLAKLRGPIPPPPDEPHITDCRCAICKELDRAVTPDSPEDSS